MSLVVTSLLRAFGQLGDPAILKVIVKSLLLTVAIFVALGALLFQALVSALAYVGANLGSTETWFVTIILMVVAMWFLFRLIAIAVLQFFADEVVAAVEQRHYPAAAARARNLPFREDLANSLRGMGRALLFNALALPFALILVFTAIGPAVVFLLVNAVLLGRELTDMGWLRHRGSPTATSPVGAFERTALGGVVAGMMLIPLLNLLAPIIGAAAGTHMVQKRLGYYHD